MSSPIERPVSAAGGPKKHHFVPVFYLGKFCRPDGKLSHCVMRSTDGKTINILWTNAAPSSVGYEKRLYRTAGDANGECRIEEKLAVEVDDPAKPAIENILDARPNTINIQMHPEAVKFIAFMAMRNPTSVKSKDVLDPYYRAGIVTGSYQNNPGPGGIFKDVDAIQPHLRTLHWYLYWFHENDGTTLVTSDRSVGIYALAESDLRTGKMLQPSPVEAYLPDNWAKPAIFTFPLSPCCAALGFRGSKRELEKELTRQTGIECDNRLPAWVNAMTAWMANHVYAGNKDAKFLLPNLPDGPGAIEFAPALASGILLPVPRNRLGFIEEFVPLADAFNKNHNIPWPPSAPN